MDLRQLRCLVAIAEARSLVGAARSLAVSQPALSKTVKALEASVGFRIFERRSRGVVLTPLGEELFARSQVILAEVARTHSELEALRSAKTAILHIGALRAAASARIPAAASRLAALQPNIRLRVDVDQNSLLIAGLARGKFDLVIGVGEGDLAKTDLHYEPLWSDHLVVAARADHPLVGQPISPSLLAAQPWIMPEVGAYRRRLEDYFFSVGIQLPTPQIICGQIQFIRAMLIRGDYLSLLPADSIDSDCTCGLLKSFPIQSPFLTRPVGLLTRQNKILTHAIRSFVTVLREVAQTGPIS